MKSIVIVWNGAGGAQPGEVHNDGYPRSSRQTHNELIKTTNVNHATPFAYPAFVVWRTMPDGERKGRVVTAPLCCRNRVKSEWTRYLKSMDPYSTPVRLHS